MKLWSRQCLRRCLRQCPVLALGLVLWLLAGPAQGHAPGAVHEPTPHAAARLIDPQNPHAPWTTLEDMLAHTQDAMPHLHEPPSHSTPRAALKLVAPLRSCRTFLVFDQPELVETDTIRPRPEASVPARDWSADGLNAIFFKAGFSRLCQNS